MLFEIFGCVVLGCSVVTAIMVGVRYFEHSRNRLDQNYELALLREKRQFKLDVVSAKRAFQLDMIGEKSKLAAIHLDREKSSWDRETGGERNVRLEKHQIFAEGEERMGRLMVEMHKNGGMWNSSHVDEMLALLEKRARILDGKFEVSVKKG